MNKSDLISAMADKAGISKAQAGEALNGFMDATTDALKKEIDALSKELNENF